MEIIIQRGRNRGMFSFPLPPPLPPPPPPISHAPNVTWGRSLVCICASRFPSPPALHCPLLPLNGGPRSEEGAFSTIHQKTLLQFLEFEEQSSRHKKRAIRGHHQSAAEAESSSSGRDGCSQKEENIRTCRAHRSLGSVRRPHYFIACHLNKYARGRAYLRYTFVSLPLLSYTRKKRNLRIIAHPVPSEVARERIGTNSNPPPSFVLFVRPEEEEEERERGRRRKGGVSCQRLPPNSRGGE